MTSDWPRPTEPNPHAESLRRDAEAAIAARRELGPEYEEHLAAGLADRVEELVAYRTAELRHTGERGSVVDQAEATTQKQRFVLAIISLAIGVPVTAVAATNIDPGLLGVAVSWAGIVGVNVAASFNGRTRRRG